MSWADSTHLAFDLFALGRAFILAPPLASSLPGNAFNPFLGPSASRMLEQAISAGVKGRWYEAEKWCAAAGQIESLGAVYRGPVDVEFATEAARYFHAAVQVGMMHWVKVIMGLEKCGEALAFKLPDPSAAVWLALAQVHCYHLDASSALWALQKGTGLVETRNTVEAQILRVLLDAEYRRVEARCRI